MSQRPSYDLKALGFNKHPSGWTLSVSGRKLTVTSDGRMVNLTYPGKITEVTVSDPLEEDVKLLVKVAHIPLVYPFPKLMSREDFADWSRRYILMSKPAF